MANDPIHVVREPETIHGIDYLPGWYFWDESWADRHGPFATREECEIALKNYCETQL